MTDDETPPLCGLKLERNGAPLRLWHRRVGLVFVIGIVLGVLVICSLWVLKDSRDDSVSATQSGAFEGMELTTERLYESSEKSFIVVQYCQVGLFVDVAIRGLIGREVSEFRQTVQLLAPPMGQRYELRSTCDAAYLAPDVVSVQVTVYRYMGDLHGYSQVVVFNFDTSTQRPLTLEDALERLDKSLGEVAGEVTLELSRRFTYVSDGAAADPANYQTFRLGKDTVTFILQEYQVAAYAFGVQEVTIVAR